MKTFHNSQELKNDILTRLKLHAEADEIIQGTGWENGKGCAVGCTLNDYSHEKYPIELGIPEWVAHLEDKIFEGLSNEEAKTFPIEFIEAVPVGVSEESFFRLECDIHVKRLTVLLKKQTELYPNDDFGVNAALKTVIELRSTYTPIEDEKYSAAGSAAVSAAWSASESASAASWSAAKSAWPDSAESASAAAWSASKSARSAWSASAAWSASESASAAKSAWSAAWQQEKQWLIEGLKNLAL